MFFSYSQLLTLLPLLTVVTAQTSDPASLTTTLNPAELCQNASATLSACNFVASKIPACYSTHGAPFVSCYCNQQYFNALFDCESEQRLCFQNNELDGQMLRLAANWKSVCGKNITFTPTTPPVSVLTSTFSIAACSAATSACADGQLRLSACSASYTADNEKYQSCICQSSVISLEYACEIRGNVSCLARPANTNNMWAAKLCPNFATVVQAVQLQDNTTATLTAFANSSAITSSLSGGFSLSISTPALPGSSSSATPRSTSTTSTGHIDKNSALAMWMKAVLCLAILKILM